MVLILVSSSGLSDMLILKLIRFFATCSPDSGRRGRYPGEPDAKQVRKRLPISKKRTLINMASGSSTTRRST